MSEPAAQRRQVRKGLPDLARRGRARARAPRTTARRRRSPVGPHCPARLSCPACDRGRKRACICGGKRKYERRALDGVEELLAAAAPPRAPPPPDAEVAPPGETAATGDEPEPDRR